MKASPLTSRELGLITGVLRHYPEVASAFLFGSRAKGTHTDRSDVDLALGGTVSSILSETIALELDELPLPYRFDVIPLEKTASPALREHIARVGISIYPAEASPTPIAD